MPMEGMNVDAVRQISRELKAQSVQLRGVSSRVDALVNGISQGWRGADADRFVNDWRSQYRQRLVTLISALEGLSNTASVNADEQRQASDGGMSPGAEIAHAGGYQINALGAYRAGVGLLDEAQRLMKLRGLDLSSDFSKVKTDSGILSTALFGADAWEAFRDAAAGDLSAEGFVDFAGKALGWGSTLLDLYGRSPAGELLSNGLSKVAGGIGAGMDFGHAMEAFQKGNVIEGAYDIAHGEIAAAGTVVPQVGWCLGAWDLGVTIGTTIAESPPAQQFQDSVVAYGAAHDADVATRYDFGSRGAQALGNLVGDNFAVAGENAAKFANGVSNFFGSMFK